ncbi:MAG: hypothetical protein H0X27_02635 [Caulobacteraceae bacterium]|nr:hypothetical protein [Caulobacteraceae bacterium]
MSKRVVFHVGLPKTGTTTIQQYLRRQDDKLRSLGFLYPGPREHEALQSHKHPLMLNAMKGRATAPSGGLDLEGCRKVVAQVFAAFRQSDLENLIWSCEGMALSAGNWDADYLKQTLEGLDLRVVLFARYIDDWVESLIQQRIRGRSGFRERVSAVKPLRLVPPPPAEGASKSHARSMLDRGAKIGGSLRVMRRLWPSAEIVVRSFDASREKGTVVSDALAAMGVPAKDAFADADEEAGVYNPTKSGLFSVLLYRLQAAAADAEIINAVAAAAERRRDEGREYKPFADRRFRFLSDENITRARSYYEELRHDYADLPAQPPFASKPADRYLPKADGVAVLDWLRPDISDGVFDKARAAYPEDPQK